MLAIAAAAVIAAVLIAVLSGGSTHRKSAAAQGSVLQVASGYLHVPTPELRRRLRAGETLGEIAGSTGGASRAGLIRAVYASRSQSVKRLHLPPAEERAELNALRRALVVQVDRARRRTRLRTAAARYLGLNDAQLSSKLTGGRTLAQVAAATPGRSRAGLVAALVAPRRTALELALKRKQITPGAERAAAAKLRSRAERQISRPAG
ncbi:MAG: hypothetical protein JWM60_822 [Solirubrobacterales bacterium]|nr:hypothetical protein [Solirubrobacterales bacterium]